MYNELKSGEAIIYVVKCFESKRHSKAHTYMYFKDPTHAIWGLIKDSGYIMRVEMVKVLIGSTEYNCAVSNSEKRYEREKKMDLIEN